MIPPKFQISPKAQTFISWFFYTSVALCLCASLYWGFQLIFYPYQHEVREGAPLMITQNLLKGINPYSFAVQPQNTYVYGILYPLLSSPLNAFLGIDIVNMRIMNFIFIALAALLLYIASYHESRNPLFSCLLSTAFFLGMFLKTFHARPEALGILLLMATVAVAHRYNYSKRALAVSTLLSVLAFFTKPYYIIGIGYISAYLFLFSSPKKSLIFFTCFLGILGVTLSVAHLIWPAYLYNNFFHFISPHTLGYSTPHMIQQVIYFFKKEFLLATLYLLFLGLGIRRESNLGLKPLLSHLGSSLSVYDLAIFISFSLFVVKLGVNTGSGTGDYLYHIMYPFFFLSFGIKGKGILSSKYVYGLVLLLLLVACGSYAQYIRHASLPLSAYKAEIVKIEKYFQTGKSILNSADTVSMAIKYQIPISDSAHSEYYFFNITVPSARWIYGPMNEKSEPMVAYTASMQQIQKNISHKNYDYVLKSWVGSYALPQDFTNYYRLETSIPYPNVLNGASDKNVEIWVPLP